MKDIAAAGEAGSAEAESYPLSPMQQGMIFHSEYGERPGLYLQQHVSTLREPVDAPALRRALESLVERHGALRTSFLLDGPGGPCQRVHPRVELPWEEHDWRGVPAEERERRFRDLLADDRLAGFDPARAPLLRFALFRMADEEFRLLWTSHHVLMDGHSRRLLLAELFEEYGALLAGTPVERPAAPSYRAHVEWLHGLDESAAREFWTGHLAGFEAPDEPAARPAGEARPGGERARHDFQLPAGLTRELEALARAEGVTLNTVVQGAWGLLLSRRSGRDDVVFGNARACRRSGVEGAARMVGLFSNTVPLRVRVREDETVRGYLRAIRGEWVAMRPHEHTPLARIQGWSEVPGGARLFESIVGFERSSPDEAFRALGPAWERRSFELHQWTSYPLALVAHGGERLSAQLLYDAGHLDARSAGRMADHFVRVLQAFAAAPGGPLHRIDPLAPGERARVLEEFNRTAAHFPADTPVHRRFEEQAARTPGAPAVLAGDRVIGYAELDARADRLAHLLRRRGVGPERRVALLLERSPEVVVALLAVLKAGAAYVPLDPAHPPERLRLIARDAGVALVLAQERTAPRLGDDPPAPVLVLDGEAGASDAAPAGPPPAAVGGRNAAYVIYTSGSTGTPKGVVVEHRSVLRLVAGMEHARFAPGDVGLMLAPLAFDASTFEIWSPLLSGAALAVMPPDTPTPELLEAVLRRHGVTVLWLTAGLFHVVAAQRPSALAGLRVVLAGGDVLQPAAVQQALEAMPGGRVVNGYGPTEATTFTACHAVASAGEVGDTVPIGRPIGNTLAYVLDPGMRPVPIDVRGELYVGGPGTARGYLGRPGLTAERFVPDPYSGEPGARLYRTGDRVRWREDGVLLFEGRADEQVKVRGFRIEPGEIEAVLLEHPGVEQAAVLPVGRGAADRWLAAFVVARAGLAAATPEPDLAAYLRRRLPEHMVPAVVEVVDRLPLTPNGKLDRRALAARAVRRPAPGGAAPRTGAEERVAAIWSEVLGVEGPGSDDDFFQLGGHSLHLIQVAARVRSAFGVGVSVSALFDHPTVAGLAGYVEAALREARAAALPPVLPAAEDGPAPLAFPQQRLWFLYRLDPASAAYNVAVALRLEGALDAAALRRSLDAVVRRHEVLRTAFEDAGGVPRQRVLPARRVPLPVVELGGAAEPLRLAGLLAEDEARRPFRLEDGEPLRCTLFRLGAEEHLLLLVLHHVVYDGWSAGVLARELRDGYAAFAAGEAPSAPPLPVQYADFARWQHRHLTPEYLGEALDYWREHLAEAEALALPSDRERSAAGVRARRLRFALPDAVGDALRAAARAAGATPFVVLLAAFDALLHRYSGSGAPVVATPVAGRDREELEGVIGFFVNTLAFRVELAGDPTFRELVGRAREVALAGFDRRHVPFERVVAALRPGREGAGPLARVMFALHGRAGAPWELAGLAVKASGVERGAAKFDLMLSMEEGPGGFAGAWEYDPGLFDAATVRRMGAHFERLLQAAVEEPESRLGALPLLSRDEELHLLVDLNRTEAEFPADLPLHRLFEAQAARTPGAPAVVFRGESLSFAELDRRAGQWARALRERGVGPESRVAVCMERGTGMIVAVLAAWKAGGAYVPLDPAAPADRLAALLAESAARVVLASGAAADALPAGGPEVLRMDADAEVAAAARGGPLEGGAGPDNLAYVIYTSGSTGTPKGVMVEHRSVANLAAALRRAVYGRRGEAAPPRVAMNGALTFDTSVKQIVQLLAGSTLVIVPEEVRYDADALAATLRAGAVEVLDCTPAQLRMLGAAGALDAPGATLTDVLVAGEAIDEPTWRRLAADPARRYWNLYGPTECTVDAALRLVAGSGGTPSIGRPLANVRLYVLDAGMQPVPTGVPGELLVGGVGVARGYLGRPDLTAERFLPDPFGPAGGRLYRTGDRVRWRADGELEFLGRVDDQVKIRGFRIEPGEVEAALREAGAREAAVVAREHEPGGRRLVAYVVRGEGGPGPAELRARLAERLPRYMLPAAVVELDALPLTRHGKVDRRALPAPPPAGADDAEPVLPGTPLEERVAEVFREVLGLERVGVHDDFFAVGGHSLLAARTVARLGEALGTQLPLRVLFDAPTVAQLAAVLAEGPGDAGGAALPPVRPVPRGAEPLPLSFAQRRLWFLQQLDPGSAAYNMPYALRLRGRLDERALRWSLARLAARHEALRTVLPSVDGEPVQVVAAPGPLRLPVVELGALPAPAREAAARRLAAAEAGRPFDLARGPLFRAVLARLDQGEHRLLLTLHHAVGDGWSTGVLVRELGALYAARERGGEPRLPPLPVQYADYAAWQREHLEGGAAGRQLDWWRERLAGAPPLLDVPTDRPRAAGSGGAAAAAPFALPPALAAALRALAREERATLFTVLLAGFQALLSRWSGQDDVLVGIPAAGRGRTELEGVVGFFVNTLAVRTDLSGGPTLRGLLRRVREGVLEAEAHQDLPFDRVVEALRPERSLTHDALVQAMFSLDGAEAAPARMGGLEVVRLPSRPAEAKFDLVIHLRDDGGAVEGSCAYRTALFDRATVERMLGHLLLVLEAMAAAPDGRADAVELLPEPERTRVLSEWNAAGAPVPSDRCVHELFAAQAARTPDAVAVVFGGEGLAYAELDRRSTRLARFLRRRGVGPDVLAGVCMERSLDLPVALLGILKAGGAYVPMDPAYPAERLALMAAETRVPVVLTESRLLPRLPAGVDAVPLDAARAEVDRESDEPLAVEVTPEHRVYAIYTSGSTGRPKATEVPHRAIPGFFWEVDYARFDERQVLLQHSSTSWDALTLELWPALLRGGRCVLHSGDGPDLAALSGAVREHGVTTLWLTAGLFNLVVDTRPELLAPLEQLMVGGEAVSLPHARQALRLHPGLRLVNGYGPSECTVFTACHVVRPGAGDEPVPLGRPVGDRRAYVLDPRLAPVPVGVPGELYVGGPAVPRGYLARPDLTAERLLPDPFGGEPGARLYRTGDRVRWRADGTLEFLGRADHQVKIRGFRVEPGEVEDHLLRCPGVREAAVVVREDLPGDRRLVAYVVPAGGERPTPAGLRARLRQDLPEYMLPSACVLLDALPLTPHGKVDRRALPAPDPVSGDAGYVPPATPAAEVLAGIWEELLGVERVGAHDGFFERGGHSLLATRMTARIQRVFGVELPVRAVFEARTLAALADRVDAALRAGAGSPRLPVLRVARGPGDALPLSFAQQRLWFLHRLDPASAAYNIPGSLRLRGPLDADALGRSLREIVSRHEALRTVFREVEGTPAQVVGPVPDRVLETGALDLPPGEARDAEARRRAREEAARPFDLAAGPPFRARLLRLADDDHVLLLTLHHVAGDGWSLGVLHGELEALYGAFLEGGASPLPELPVQYADYAAWQREHLAGERLERQLAWWRERLAGAPPLLELPTDRPRPAQRSPGGATVEAALPAELADALRALARGEGATLFMALAAAFHLLLSRYSRQDQVVTGVPVAGRTQVETEALIGFFVNTLPLRGDLSGDPSFRELLARVREGALGAYAHQEVPFEKLVEELQPERGLNHTPLFQVMFALQSAPSRPLRLPGLRVVPLRAGTSTAKFDLTLAVTESGAGLAAGLEYATDLFDRSTAERVLRHLRVLLEGIAADPRRPAAELELVGGAEREEVLSRFAAPARAYPADATLHGLFARQAARTPERVAATFAGEAATYAELDRRSTRLARELRRRGAGPEARVGLCVERSLEMLVGILAILKAGAAYVPLDPAYPPERLAFVVEDAGIRLLLAGAPVRDRVPAEGVETLGFEADGGPAAEDGSGPLPDGAGPDNLAYVIYTSGSTGTPKGVQVTHAAVARLFAATDGWFGFGADDVWTLFHSFAFDFSVWEIWGALLRGGRLVVVPFDTSRSPAAFRALLADEGVTVLNQTPSAFRELIQADAAADGAGLALRWVVFGGEALEPGTLRPWMERHGEERPRLVNMYGITETTVHVTFRPVTRADVERGSASPVGRPIPDLGVYVLDPRMNPVPVGVPGEMYVAGAGLARGYLGRPALTAERFVPDPFGGAAGARLYRSGDLARWLRTGELEYLGRADQQVKVRGFRIEPGEIEARLAAHPGVAEAVVAVREDAPGDQRLVAYFTHPREAPSARELRAHLASALPEYMVPAAFVALDRIPLTGNGKTDRRALPAPGSAAPAGLPAAPRTPLEEALAGIWGEVLGTGPVGIHDGFFELGGHSLLAVRLVSRIERELGETVPLHAVLAGATVASMAAGLGRGRTTPAEEGPLVRIRAGGAGRPLFCVHAVDGHVLSYGPLARRLRPGRPVYGLQAAAEDGSESPARVEDMAARYVAAVREVQPAGPYALAGWSLGGAVAFEMARRLRAAGEEVELLALLDAPRAMRSGAAGDEASLLVESLRHLLDGGLPAGFREERFRALSPADRLEYLRAEAVAAGALAADVDAGRLRGLLRVRAALLRALRAYRPGEFDGRVHYFEAAERPASGPPGDRALDWEALSRGGGELHRVPGSHFSMLREPQVQALAAALDACLDRAEARPGHPRSRGSGTTDTRKT